MLVANIERNVDQLTFPQGRRINMRLLINFILRLFSTQEDWSYCGNDCRSAAELLDLSPSTIWPNFLPSLFHSTPRDPIHRREWLPRELFCRSSADRVTKGARSSCLPRYLYRIEGKRIVGNFGSRLILAIITYRSTSTSDVGNGCQIQDMYPGRKAGFRFDFALCRPADSERNLPPPGVWFPGADKRPALKHVRKETLTSEFSAAMILLYIWDC